MVQYVFAFDINRNPIYVNEAIPGETYFCPDCNREMFAKNQGKIIQHHFAHFCTEYNGSGNTGEHEGTGESITHSNTKLFLFKALNEYLSSNKSQSQRLGYGYRDESVYGTLYHSSFGDRENKTIIYNILECVTDIKLEYTINGENGDIFRPDIALLCNNKVIRVIEIKHKHRDEPEKTEYYKNNEIEIVKVEIEDFDSFLDLQDTFEKHGRIKNMTIFKSTKNIKYWLPIIKEAEQLNNDIRIIKTEMSSIQSGYSTLLKDIYIGICVSFNPKIAEIYKEAGIITTGYKELYKDYKGLSSDINGEINWAKDGLRQDLETIKSEIKSIKYEYDYLEYEYTDILEKTNLLKEQLINEYNSMPIEEVIEALSDEYTLLSFKYIELLRDIKVELKASRNSLVNKIKLLQIEFEDLKSSMNAVESSYSRLLKDIKAVKDSSVLIKSKAPIYSLEKNMKAALKGLNKNQLKTIALVENKCTGKIDAYDLTGCQIATIKF